EVRVAGAREVVAKARPPRPLAAARLVEPLARRRDRRRVGRKVGARDQQRLARGEVEVEDAGRGEVLDAGELARLLLVEAEAAIPLRVGAEGAGRVERERGDAGVGR